MQHHQLSFEQRKVWILFSPVWHHVTQSIDLLNGLKPVNSGNSTVQWRSETGCEIDFREKKRDRQADK